MPIDDSTWKLPSFVSFAVHDDEMAARHEPILARKGHAVLRKGRPAAVGQLVAIEFQLRDGAEWGILQGHVDRVRDDGRLELTATMTSTGPAHMAITWSIVLRYYPEAKNGGAWVVEEMAPA